MDRLAISKTRNAVFCGLFAALIALGAFIRIPIPFVPFTLQFLFTTLAGSVLGARLGATAVGVYIALGLIGLPIFSMGGGLSYIFQPTFGYLAGFCLGAYVTGKIVGLSDNQSFTKMVVANFAGLFAVYFCGMVYFYFISNFYTNSHIGFWTLFVYCFLLAVPGDIAICFFAAVISMKLVKMKVFERSCGYEFCRRLNE